MGKGESPLIVWFRSDLRIDDNPALKTAIESGQPVLPVFILDDESEGKWKPGGASRWWLHHALEDLRGELDELELKLVLQSGDSRDELFALIENVDACGVYWNRRYEPRAIERDRRIKAELRSKGYDAKSFNASLLFEPHEVENKSGNPFKVFTPFWKHCLAKDISKPLSRPATTARGCRMVAVGGVSLESLELLPKIEWDEGFYEQWDPTMKGAKRRLGEFVENAAADYGDHRDRPELDGTSRLSPFLHFGQIGPRQIWEAFRGANLLDDAGARKYLAEIGWREFSYHLMFHFPDTTEYPLRREFEDFPWQFDEAGFDAWRKGQTGYPFVDAGMRQLWATGWMHNRVRMVAASFLVKHLRIHWKRGAEWFWDTLVDADLASNTQGWQWTAGCGADAAPYFRVFNPYGQGERFDPEGDYIRQWLPELRKLSAKQIHRPWEASETVLRKAGVVLGKDYPFPMVEHSEARRLALAAWKELRKSAAG